MRSKDLKAVVLAAGMGSRMNPLTSERPKHLLPVAGEPVLKRTVRTLLNIGTEEVIVVVGYLAEKVVSALSEFGSKRIDFVRQEAPLGTAHALLSASDAISSEREFLLVYGDVTLKEEPVRKLLETVESGPIDGALLGVIRPDPWRFGTLLVKEGLLHGILEKSKDVRPPALVNAGIYVLPGEVVDVANKIDRSPRGEYELTDAVAELVKKGRRIAVVEDPGEWWFDLGGPSELLKANVETLVRELGSGSAIRRGAVIDGRVSVLSSFVGEGAFVGDGSLIELSVLMGSTSVGKGSRLQKTLVLEGAKVGQGAKLVNCILGPDSFIPSGVELAGDPADPVVVPPHSTYKL
ncbi:MAG: sugar phosphate nucleotidyltransferase [Thaumarchaeota archaeon]|nr:sugar phosphate nucleotidyltransferase [Candidatus Calditenuaceae archaeon]MDW8186615.1 sugar phosphate nucleotidyltransferase [Nitrososphaerota archaeon]